MKDAVIGMAILVVILALWRLHSRPRTFGQLGVWAQTNIFGATTLSLIPGPGQGGSEGQTLAPVRAPSGSSNQDPSPSTNLPTTSNLPAAGLASHPSTNNASASQFVSTNLLRTNGPVTIIAVPPSDLVETPPGVVAAANVPEAAALDRRLGEVSAKGG